MVARESAISIRRKSGVVTDTQSCEGSRSRNPGKAQNERKGTSRGKEEIGSDDVESGTPGNGKGEGELLGQVYDWIVKVSRMEQ